jgi:hypothetical protein
MKKILMVWFGISLCIINGPIKSWNAIGKYWLSGLDLKFSETRIVL